MFDSNRKFSIVSSTTSTHAGEALSGFSAVSAEVSCVIARSRWQRRHQCAILEVSGQQSNLGRDGFRMLLCLVGERFEPFGAALERCIPQLVYQRGWQAAELLQ